MDVLRLAGVPGVGKSSVAWALAQLLATEEVRVGYVDIDQLGMCYPAPVDDPERWVLKETALTRVAARFAEAGAERLVVSGVADPAQPPPGNGHPTVSLWLDADEETRRARLAPRGWSREQIAEVLDVGTGEAAVAGAVWTRVGTDGSSIEQTVRDVLGRWDQGDAATGSPATASATENAATDAGGRVVWITGPRCAGASMVGWAIASGLWASEQRTGFLDVAQLGFAWNMDRGVGAANAAELHRLFAGIGATTVIAAAPIEISPDEVRRAFPAADVRFIRLDADPQTLRDRAARRVAGEGPGVAGDDLIGGSPEAVDHVVVRGVRQREMPLRAGEQLIDATASVSRVAARVMAVLPD